MKKNILFSVPLMAAVLISACADSGDDNNTPPAPQTYSISGKIDYAGKAISSAKVCLDVNNNGLADDTACYDTTDGNYNFTSANNPAYYPLAAYIKESQSQQVNAKITVGSTEYDSILYAPRGKTGTISIATTLAKSLMDKDSSLSLTNAETQATTIINKADAETVLNVYNNAINNSNITNIETSIRGLVNVITDKLKNEPSITENTSITVTQVEVNTANNEIANADEELPQEPVTPGEKTPLEKVTEMLAGAEIKNSAESPVNLNEHVDPALNSYNPMTKIYELGIKSDAFGEFSTETFASQMSMAGQIGYAENGWPSDKQGFEVFPNEEDKTGYTFTNAHSSAFEHSDACKAGKVNGITYKPVIEEAVNNNIQTSMQECVKNSGIEMSGGGQFNPDDMDKMMKCYADSYYQYKDSIKIEKWYWTIDTTQIDVCKNGSSSNITAF